MSRATQDAGLQRVRSLTQGAAALALLGTGAVVFVSAQTAAQAAQARTTALSGANTAAGTQNGLSGPAVAPTAGLTPDQQAQLLAQQQQLQSQQLTQQQLQQLQQLQLQQPQQQQQQAPQSGGS